MTDNIDVQVETQEPETEEWGWPPNDLKPFPIYCRLISTDQWIKSHVDPASTVRAVKSHLLSKCGISSQGGNASHATVLRSRKGPNIRLGRGGKAKDFGEAVLSKRRRSLSSVFLSDLPARNFTSPSMKGQGPTRLSESSDDQSPAAKNRVPEDSATLDGNYSLFSFSSGYQFRDDLPLSKYHLRRHDLLELHRTESYICLDRGPSYVDVYYSGPVEICTQPPEEFRTMPLSMVILKGSLTFWHRGDELGEALHTYNLRTLILLEERLMSFATTHQHSSLPYYIFAGFAVPSSTRLQSSGRVIKIDGHGESRNLLLPDPCSHEHLLRILAGVYSENRARLPKDITERREWRSKAYRRALNRDVAERSESDSAESLDERADSGSDSEQEWEGWRTAYESTGILRARQSLGTMRRASTNSSIERTRTR